jgi:type IV secretion system protein VirB10
VPRARPNGRFGIAEQAKDLSTPYPDLAARTSKLFAPTTAPVAPSHVPSKETSNNTSSASDETFVQNGQDRKLMFVNAPPDRRTTATDRLVRPASSFVVQAGAVIPAALITGIRSDLPGEITAHVTENVLTA